MTANCSEAFTSDSVEDDGAVLVGQEVEAKVPVLNFRGSQRDEVSVVEQLGRNVDDVAVRPKTQG